jgi:hypothetical protein
MSKLSRHKHAKGTAYEQSYIARASMGKILLVWEYVIKNQGRDYNNEENSKM